VKNIIWIAAIGAGIYAAYEWALSQCATSGSSLYGGQICGFISPTVAAPASTAIVSTATPGQTPTPAQQSNPVAAAPAPTPVVIPPTLDPKPVTGCPNNADCATPIGPGFFAQVNSQFTGVSGLSANRIPAGFINRRRIG
jgi:hypothetical protein